MNVNYFQTFVVTPGSHEEESVFSDQTMRVRELSADVSNLLRDKGIGVRITLGEDSVVIGDQASSLVNPIEFVFGSETHFARLFRRPRLFDFSVAYLDGQMDIRGSIFRAAEVLDAIREVTDRPQSFLERVGEIRQRLMKVIPIFTKRFESLDHYARSAEAYEQFLDKHMQYTCAHFPLGDEDLDRAQIAKFELIKDMVERHSGPMSGGRHLDIGCGWGGMVSYFGGELGMCSEGLTNTPQQKEYGKRRYDVELLLSDFLELRSVENRYDLVTVVGMIEHLTPYRRSQLLKCIHRVLEDDGSVYLQCIVKPSSWIGGDTYRLAKSEVFPGHFLETHDQTMNRVSRCGFKVLETHNHAADYGRTTAYWVEKIQENEASLTKLIGRRQYRLYLAYLAYASQLFSSGRGSLMRYVLKKA